MGIMTIMLFVEYRFFYDQASKMMELKEEYRAYGAAFKRVLNEYNALKEQTEGAPSLIKTAATDGEKDFLVINRELSYLKQSMLDYCERDF